MNESGISTLAVTGAAGPFTPVGRQAVGLENADAREEPLAPVEQAAANVSPFNRGNATDPATEPYDPRAQQQLQQQIRALAAREREVIAHEQAHAAVGGQFAGAPSYTYERGPDGVNYAVGGEVSISLPAGGSDPAATLAAARQVRSAALAPANPSAQDRSVAALASQIEAQAIAELAAQKTEQQAADQAESKQARLEESQQQQAREEQQDEEQANAARSSEQQQASRRSAVINEQLITVDNLQRDSNVGRVVDQLA